MSEKKKDKQAQLDNLVKTKVKGLGLEALFHLVSKDSPSNSQIDAQHPESLENATLFRKIKDQFTRQKNTPLKNRIKNFFIHNFTSRITNVVGIYLDSNSIKIVEFKNHNDQISLLNSLYIPIPFILTSTNNKWENFITETLKQVLPAQKLKNTFICSLVPRSKVVVKYVTLPTVNKSEIANMIEFEAEHHLPFPIHELEIDYHIIESTEGQSRIILIAIRKDDINQHLNLLHKSGIQVTSVNVTSLALYNALLTNQTDNQIALQINIGSDFTDVNIVENNILKSTRGFHWGSKNLTNEMTKKLNVSFEIAEKIKKENGIIITKQSANDVAEKADRCARDWTKHLVGEINKTVQHFHLQEGIKPVGKVIITGGGSQLLNLDELLKEQLKLKVIIQRAPEDIKYTVNSEQFTKYFQDLNILFGLTKCYFNDIGIKVNLLPPKEKKRIAQKLQKRKAIAYLSLTLMVLACAFIIPKSILGVRNWHINQLDQRISKLKPEVALAQKLQSKVQTIENYISTKNSSMDVLRELTLLVSSDIIIYTFIFEKQETVTLIGQAGSHASVVKLSEGINESSLFNKATIKYTRKVDRNKENVNFEITISFE